MFPKTTEAFYAYREQPVTYAVRLNYTSFLIQVRYLCTEISQILPISPWYRRWQIRRDADQYIAHPSLEWDQKSIPFICKCRQRRQKTSTKRSSVTQLNHIERCAVSFEKFLLSINPLDMESGKYLAYRQHTVWCFPNVSQMWVGGVADSPHRFGEIWEPKEWTFF